MLPTMPFPCPCTFFLPMHLLLRQPYLLPFDYLHLPLLVPILQQPEWSRQEELNVISINNHVTTILTAIASN